MDDRESKQRWLILIVEDQVSIAEGLRDIIEAEFFDVAIAHNGVQGVAMAHQLRPNLIFMNWMMPKMDGIEATRRLRADEQFKDIPIIMGSARHSEQDIAYAFENGVTHYVVYPMNADDVLKPIYRYYVQNKED